MTWILQINLVVSSFVYEPHKCAFNFQNEKMLFLWLYKGMNKPHVNALFQIKCVSRLRLSQLFIRPQILCLQLLFKF